MNRIRIGGFRAGMWVIMLAGVAFFAAQNSGRIFSWGSAEADRLAGIVFAVLTTWAVYLLGSETSVRTTGGSRDVLPRMGFIAAAFLLGNTAFLDAGRSGGAMLTLGWIMVETLAFAASGMVRDAKFRLPLEIVLLAACAFLPGVTGFPGYTGISPVEGWATALLGGAAALLYLAGMGRHRFDLRMPVIIAWGVVNLVFVPGGILGILPPSAVLAAWLVENPDHRRGAVRICGAGVVLALRLVPVLLAAVWLVMTFTRPSGIEIPLLLPMILYGVLILCDWGAMKKFKAGDRRAVAVAVLAASVVTWMLLMVEPVRLQEEMSIRRVRASAETAHPGE